MTKLPPNVEDWDFGTIANLLHEGYDEDVNLEFKSELNDKTEKIPKTACAFVNTDGGFLVIGVDNDKTKNLKIVERIIGVDHTDDLHKRIIDKIKNIQPQIPIENLIFRKSNIKLENSKVIVILKIIRSPKRPHQYDFIFYKRMPGSNERMSVEEIKSMFLDSEKSVHHISLMFFEFSTIKNSLVEAKKSLKKNQIPFAIGSLSYLDHTSSVYFLHERSFLYSNRITELISTLIHQLRLLSDLPESFDDVTSKEGSPAADELAKERGLKDGKEFVKKVLTIRVESALSALEQLEKEFGLKIADSVSILPEKKKKNKK